MLASNVNLPGNFVRCFEDIFMYALYPPWNANTTCAATNLPSAVSVSWPGRSSGKTCHRCGPDIRAG